MSNKPTLKMLADKRDLILLAEIGALIQVPVAPWGTYFPALGALAQAMPAHVS
jgi:hypothetical protein